MATVGYSSRCKVCNSAHRTEIERWVRDGLSFRQVSEKLRQEHDERISHGAIQRHMTEHFDVQAVARDKYEKAKIQEQHEQSQQLMEQEAGKLLSEIDMLDKVARQNFELYAAAHGWLMELVSTRAQKIPQALVQLAKSSSEEIRQHLKQKQELLGLNTDEEKKVDFGDLLLAAWEQMSDGEE